jgi:hypothetical protein
MNGEQSKLLAYSVEHFSKTFAAFAKAVDEAVTVADQHPEYAGTRALEAWQSRAQPLILKQNASVQKAVEDFRAGAAESILAQARDQRALAKDLDGFPLSFAGPEKAEKLEKLETAVVLAAYRVCVVAGVA